MNNTSKKEKGKEKAPWLVELESKFVFYHNDPDHRSVDGFWWMNVTYRINSQFIIDTGIMPYDNIYDHCRGDHKLPLRFYYSSGMLHPSAWKALVPQKVIRSYNLGTYNEIFYEILNSEKEGFTVDPNSEEELSVAIGREVFKYKLKHVVAEFTLKRTTFTDRKKTVYGFFIKGKPKLEFIMMCTACNNKSRHYCSLEKGWTPPKKCTSCNGYDDHYCSSLQRSITLCTRCDIEDRACFCC